MRLPLALCSGALTKQPGRAKPPKVFKNIWPYEAAYSKSCEILGLRWQDIDFDNHIVRLRNTVVKPVTLAEDEHTKYKARQRDLSLEARLKNRLTNVEI